MAGKSKNSIYEYILENIVLFLAISLLFVMFATVVNRYFLRGSMAWSTEVLKFLFIWVNFLGAALGVRRGSHIGVQLLYNVISSRKIKVFMSFLEVSFTIGALLVLSIVALLLIARIYALGQVTPYLGLPYIFWYLAIPVGYCLMIVFLAENIRDIKGGHDYASRD